MSTIKNIDKLKETLTAINDGIAPCGDGLQIITTLNFVEFETENISCWITLRPSYCDRGKYLWGAQSKDARILEIDDADLFPRYFFNIEALSMEIESWLTARNQTEVSDIQIKRTDETINKKFIFVNPELNYKTIDTIWAFLSEDEGGEGIVAQLINDTWMTFVTGEERVVRKMMPLANDIAAHSGKKVKLVKFTNREDVEVIKWG